MTDILAQLGSDRGGAWTPTFPVVREQQRDLRARLRRGFGDVESVIRWQHAVAALSAGEIDADWHQTFCTDRWALAALMADQQDREAFTPHPPSDAQAQAYREEVIERDLIPAFHDGVRMFRQQATDITNAKAGVSDPENQRFLGLRPRLHQLSVAQHQALMDALAIEGPPLTARHEVNDWIDQVNYATAGFTPDAFDAAVSARLSMWRQALADPGATLWRKLAQDVLPPMNHALSEAVKSASEKIESRTTREQPDLHA